MKRSARSDAWIKGGVSTGERARKFGHQPALVMFVGKAQEKATVFRTEKRKHPATGRAYPWIVRTTALVPPESFEAGANDVQLYAVVARGDRLGLQPLGGTE